MTLVLGMYYDNQKGALIASDSRMIRNSNYKQTQKIFSLENLITANCGLVWAREELNQNVELLLDTEEDMPIKKIFQQAQAKLYEEYALGENPVLCEDEMPTGVCGFYTDHPEIFKFFDRITEPIYDYSAIGQEDEDTQNMFRKFYRRDISEKQAIELAVYSIIEASKNNIYVDDDAQIALIDKNGCRILNYDEDGNFNFRKPEILKTKKEMYKLSEEYEKSFDVLLKGDKDKKRKFIELINE